MGARKRATPEKSSAYSLIVKSLKSIAKIQTKSETTKKKTLWQEKY